MYTITYKEDRNNVEDALAQVSISLNDSVDAYTFIASCINFMLINGYQPSSIKEALNDILSTSETDNMNVLSIYF